MVDFVVLRGLNMPVLEISELCKNAQADPECSSNLVQALINDHGFVQHDEFLKKTVFRKDNATVKTAEYLFLDGVDTPAFKSSGTHYIEFYGKGNSDLFEYMLLGYENKKNKGIRNWYGLAPIVGFGMIAYLDYGKKAADITLQAYLSESKGFFAFGLLSCVVMYGLGVLVDRHNDHKSRIESFRKAFLNKFEISEKPFDYGIIEKAINE